MNQSINILEGIVNNDELDQYDHMAMPNYLKIINCGIMELSNHLFTKDLSKNSKRLVASRCNLEFKNELLLHNKWNLIMQFRNYDIKYLTLDFKIKSNSQIKAKAKLILVAFDLLSRKSVKLNSKEIFLIEKFFNL